MKIALVPVVATLLVVFIASFKQGVSVVSAVKGKILPYAFCSSLLHRTQRYRAELVRQCVDRVEHFDIANRIESACLGSPSSSKSALKKWKKFKQKYRKAYVNAFEEVKSCFSFQSNLRRIQLHNRRFRAGKSNYSLKITTYADLTDEEFKATNLGQGGVWRVKPTALPKLMEVKDLPSSVDWIKKGYVTEARDQGRCGSCWAFAAVGAVEGQYAKRTGILKQLSVQELVDCTYKPRNGCEGGSYITAFKYIHKEGIASEKDYPYSATFGQCRLNTKKVTHVKRYYTLPQYNERLIQRAVATVGPVVTAIFATPEMRFFDGGLCDAICNAGRRTNHAMVIVGYGKTTKGQPYWLLKNSLGKDWGENGFVKVPRGSAYCNIGTETSFPGL